VDLGPVEAGDILAVGCSGAYGLTASPLHFITHEPPKEILVETRDGRPVMRDITLDGPVARPPGWAPQ
jgi:diaminopimelate decarboxylase